MSEAGLLYLGGLTRGRKEIEEGLHLRRGEFCGCFAVGYTRPAMQRLLAEMPAEPPRMSDWIDARESFDQYLSGQPDRVLAHPRLATLAHLLPYEDPVSRDQFLP